MTSVSDTFDYIVVGAGSAGCVVASRLVKDHGATVLLLMPFGVSTSQAITLAVLWFLVMSAISLSGAGFYLLGGKPERDVLPRASGERGLHAGATRC